MHMGRLSPGTKLQEPALARVLKVSRERVRKALHRLVHEGWLQAVPNRGTFVPRLTIGEMRQIYDVRTMLEAAIVRRLSAEHGPSAARRLKAHINKERLAVRNDDRGRLFGLSGEFHVLLAGPHDHADIAKEILAHNVEKASQLMLDHLLGLVELQSASPPPRSAVALEEAFRGITAARRRV